MLTATSGSGPVRPSPIVGGGRTHLRGQARRRRRTRWPPHGDSSVIRRSTLRQQIADALRDEVLAARLPSGHPFTVKEIAEQYGVSATPVREALLDLCAQGLLDVEQHRGFKVHAFTADDFRAMVEARTLIIEGIFRSGVDQALRATAAGVLISIRRRADEAARAARAA